MSQQPISPLSPDFVTVAPTDPICASDGVPLGGRYRLLDEIARGGMGVVHRATDTVLKREVAIKVLQKPFGEGSDGARRFVDEARITAQLQHPGIPAVHDLGTFSDGRPFLAMKLVKGQTLDLLLRERSDATMDRGRFLAVFEQICHAVGYAHAHDVIHRDLKPSNVMVGAHNEVQVMDWGLAKVLRAKAGDPGYDPEATTAPTEVRAQCDSDGSETQAGTILGTLSFMPPEQAIGAIGKVDQRSDVFGLGAILAVILTGKPPFHSGSAETVRIKASQGNLDDCFARLDACKAEAELVALCKQCLSPDKNARPANASEVARTVAGLRATADERARQAELQRARAETTTREQIKRRKVQLVLAGTVVLALLLAGVGWSAWRADREMRRQKTSESIAVALSRADQSQGQAETIQAKDPAGAEAAFAAWKETLAAVERAESILQAGVGDDQLAQQIASRKTQLQDRVEGAEKQSLQIKNDRQLLEDLDRAKMRAMDSKDALLDRKGSSQAYAEAFKQYGIDTLQQSPVEVHRSLSHLSLDDRQTVAFAIDYWLLHSLDDARIKHRLCDIVNHLDPTPWKKSLREILMHSKEKPSEEAIQSLVRETTQQPLPPAEMEYLGVMLAQRIGRAGQQGFEMAIALLKQANRQYPGRFFVHYFLAQTLDGTTPMTLDNLSTDFQLTRQAIGYWRAALALRPHDPSVRLRLSLDLAKIKEFDEGLIHFRQGCELSPPMGLLHSWFWENSLAIHGGPFLPKVLEENRQRLQQNPQDVGARMVLATIHRARQDWTQVVAEYRELQRLMPDSEKLRFFFVHALRSQGEWRESMTEMRKMRSARWQLVAPLLALGEIEEALIESRRGIAEYEDPTTIWSNIYFEFGQALYANGEWEAALQAVNKSIESYRRQTTAPIVGRVPTFLQEIQTTIRWEKSWTDAGGKLKDETKLTVGERLELARFRFRKKDVGNAVRFYREAFTADGKVAEDPTAGHRFEAARAALRASIGAGIDTQNVNQAGRVELRRQALQWLTAELELCRKTKQARASEMGRWLAHRDFASVRDDAALEQLPSEEQQAWRRFWKDVELERSRKGSQ